MKHVWKIPENAKNNREMRLVERGWGKIPAGRHRMKREERSACLVCACRSDQKCKKKKKELASTMYHIYTSYICANYCMCVDAVKCMCVRVCTWAAELLALDLPDSFVGEPSRAGAAGAARLDGIVLQVVCQPLQMAVTDKGVLCQVTAQRHTEHTKHIQVSRRAVSIFFWGWP